MPLSPLSLTKMLAGKEFAGMHINMKMKLGLLLLFCDSSILRWAV
jgi:hypothetical protein